MKTKKLLAIILAVLMLVSLLPVAALAAEWTDYAPTVSVSASELGEDGTMSVSVSVVQKKNVMTMPVLETPFLCSRTSTTQNIFFPLSAFVLL